MRNFRRLACGEAAFFLCALALAFPVLRSQSQAAPAPGVVSVGAKAVSLVLDHYVLNTVALEATTGDASPAKGSWSIAKIRPQVCPDTAETCVQVFYRIPASAEPCFWVVLLHGDGSSGEFLDQNEDAARYFVRKLSEAEAGQMVTHREKPVYPPIAAAAHVEGVVTVAVLLSSSATIERVDTSGPAMVRYSAAAAARGWTFKPLLVGSRQVPYQVPLSFTFRTKGPGSSSIEMKP